MTVAAFDLDGTLLMLAVDTDFRDMESVARLRPNEAVVARARALRRRGHDVVVVTGRQEALRWITEAQVMLLLGPGVSVVMQADGVGPAGLVAMKTAALASHAPAWFVGDSRFDAEAARRAGTPFVWASAFGAGEQLPEAAPNSAF